MFCVLLSYLVARRCGVIVVDARFTAVGAQTKRKGGEPSCREADGGLLRPCVHVWLAVARGTWLCAWWESSGACDACVGVAAQAPWRCCVTRRGRNTLRRALALFSGCFSKQKQLWGEGKAKCALRVVFDIS